MRRHRTRTAASAPRRPAPTASAGRAGSPRAGAQPEAVAVTIPDVAWVPADPSAPAERLSAVVVLGGLACRADAWRVTVDPATGEQAPTSPAGQEEFLFLSLALPGNGALPTTTIRGGEYVVVIAPDRTVARPTT